MNENFYRNCRLCPRNCGADRETGAGFCGMGNIMKAARAGLHFYEEPHISGTGGSGTVFFSGCTLKCIYCQNRDISGAGGRAVSSGNDGLMAEGNGFSSGAGRAVSSGNGGLQSRDDRRKFTDPGAAGDGTLQKQEVVQPLMNLEHAGAGAEYAEKTGKLCGRKPDFTGYELGIERLADIFMEQQARGAHNINLVTGTHFTPSIAEAIRLSRKKGLSIPTVWNSSGYEKAETLKLLEGLVDVWLPDFKTLSPKLGKKYMNAPDYPEAAKEALKFMAHENGEAVFQNGLMVKGVNVRHLVIPGSTKDSMDVIEYLHKTYGGKIWISIMSQYTPMGNLPFEELNRKLTKREYAKVVDFAISIGVENAMIQEGGAAEASFIPGFDGTGIVL